MTTTLAPSSLLIGVNTASVPDVWADIVHLLEEAMRHGDGRFGLADIFDNLINGCQHLWVTQHRGRIRSMLICEVMRYPRFPVLFVSYMAGSLRDLVLHQAAFEAYYRERGINVFETWGRPGFGRVLGYAPAHVVLRKELSDEARTA